MKPRESVVRPVSPFSNVSDFVLLMIMNTGGDYCNLIVYPSIQNVVLWKSFRRTFFPNIFKTFKTILVYLLKTNGFFCSMIKIFAETLSKCQLSQFLIFSVSCFENS